MKIFTKMVLTFFLLLNFFACQSLQKNKLHASRTIDANGIFSEKQLARFLRKNNKKIKRKTAKLFARLYIEEARAEKMNSDIAFVQMCLETGFLRFGGLVSADMHNYCGLGSIDENNRGLTFPTEADGVRAHIQHLHAYGTTRELTNALIDSRYKYVQPRGKAKTIFDLASTWASDKNYGEKLDALLTRLEN